MPHLLIIRAAGEGGTERDPAGGPSWWWLSSSINTNVRTPGFLTYRWIYVDAIKKYILLNLFVYPYSCIGFVLNFEITLSGIVVTHFLFSFLF